MIGKLTILIWATTFSFSGIDPSNDSLKIREYIESSHNLRYNPSNPDYRKADSLENLALALAQEHKWPWAIYRVYRLRSAWVTMKGNYHDAIKFDQISLQIAGSHNLGSTITSLIDLSNDYIGLKNYGIAYYYLTQAKGLNPDSLNASIIHLNSSIIHKELGNLNEAIKEINESKKIGLAIKDLEGLLYAQYELSDIYIKLGNYESARTMLLTIMKEAKMLAIEMIPQIHVKLAESSMYMNDITSAEIYCDSAMNLYGRYSNHYGQIQVMIIMSDLYLLKGSKSKAISILQEGLEMTIDDPDLQPLAPQLLSKMSAMDVSYNKQYINALHKSIITGHETAIIACDLYNYGTNPYMENTQKEVIEKKPNYTLIAIIMLLGVIVWTIFIAYAIKTQFFESKANKL